jgi:hypothetical protein
MPYDFSASGPYYAIRLHGQMAEADLQQLMDDVVKAEQAAPRSLNRIIDSTDVERFDIHFGDVMTFVNQRKAAPPKNPIKTAILVQREVALGVARMFQTLNDHPFITIRIVNNREEAERWFAEDTDCQP